MFCALDAGRPDETSCHITPPCRARVAYNVRAVLLPGLSGSAGIQVRAWTRAFKNSSFTSPPRQALRDWDLWGPLLFTMTLVRSQSRAVLPCLTRLASRRAGGAAFSTVTRSRVRVRHYLRRRVCWCCGADAQRAASGVPPGQHAPLAAEPRACARRRAGASFSFKASPCWATASSHSMYATCPPGCSISLAPVALAAGGLHPVLGVEEQGVSSHCARARHACCQLPFY